MQETFEKLLHFFSAVNCTENNKKSLTTKKSSPQSCEILSVPKRRNHRKTTGKHGTDLDTVNWVFLKTSMVFIFEPRELNFNDVFVSHVFPKSLKIPK